MNIQIKLPEGFLEEEIRSGYKVTTEMKKVWAVELDLLQRFLQACEKYHLYCFADAGTLLGAVRHKGFIPWDDDIDLVMFREDYDKMVELAPEEFEKPYFFQNTYSDTDYPRGHAQFRNSDTTGILLSERDKDIRFNQGIFLDIFVLDGVVRNRPLLKKQQFEIEYHKRIVQRLASHKKADNLKGKLLEAWMRIANVTDIRKQAQKMDDLLRKYSVEELQMVAPLSFIFETKKRIRNKHLYDETIWLPFEFMEIPAPIGYDEFLTRRYGDYMKPAQIPTTHGGVLFDTEKAYTEYLKRRKLTG